MTVFSKYAQCYDLLYANKDYEGEAQYITSLLEKHQSLDTKKILEMGCGTGHHASHLINQGYSLHGIDLSAEMIKTASAQYSQIAGLSFQQADATTYSSDISFDAIISLFHVASYQVTDEAINSFIANAHNNLKPGGLFIFDFWHGRAVESDPPTCRTKSVENESIKVIRHATPITDKLHNKVTVEYDIVIHDKATGCHEEVKESHNMRYFFYTELKHIAFNAGFEVIADLEWMRLDKHLSPNNWNGGLVLKRI